MSDTGQSPGQQSWDQGICNEKSGFLFRHACGENSDATCSECQKPVCYAHQKTTDAGDLCTTCTKKWRREQNQNEVYEDDDPYMHSAYYYSGYGYYGLASMGLASTMQTHDTSDFTEADGLALADESDDAFEEDMYES